MEATLGILDYSIIFAYIFFALGVGVYFSKKASRGAESYFLGGRTLPWWLLAISMVATSFASDTPLVVTEFVRQRGIQRIWWVFVQVIPLIMGIFLFSRMWRRAALITDAEFYELRFDGKPAAFLRGANAFMSGVVTNLIIMAWVILGMKSVIKVMTPLDDFWSLTLLVLVALVYATLAGFYGVAMTDFVQFFIAMFSMIFLAVISVIKFGGMEKVLDTIKATEGFGENTISMLPSFGSFNLDVVSLLILVCVLSWNDAGGYAMQRFSACRTEQDAIKASIFMAIFQACRPWMWAVVALVSVCLFPAMVGEFSEYEDRHAYAMVMNTYLGPGLKGLLVTAFLAAFMSTIDTHLNWGTSYVMTDMYARFIRPKHSPREYILVTYAAMAVLMILAALTVKYFTSITMAWEIMAFLAVGGGIIKVARWFWWRVNAWTQITAMFMGIGACAMDVFLRIAYLKDAAGDYVKDELGNFSGPMIPGTKLLGLFDPSVTGNVAWIDERFRFEIKILVFTALVIVVSLIVTYMTKPTPKDKLEAFYKKVRPGGFWGGVSPEVRALKGKALSLRSALDIVWGLLLCYGISLGIGYSILLQWGYVCVCIVAAIVGAIGTYFWYQRQLVDIPVMDDHPSLHEEDYAKGE
jgi:Na+/proline symporter